MKRIKLIADIIAFLVAWVLVTIIARVLMGVIGIIGKIPVIGGVNKLAGAAVGAGIGLIDVDIKKKGYIEPKAFFELFGEIISLSIIAIIA